MVAQYVRSTDAATSERLARGLTRGTTVLVNGKWFRVLSARVAGDGGLDLDVEHRDPVNIDLLDLGHTLGVAVRWREPAEPERRTYTIARTSHVAETWARTQGDTGWSEWRGTNGHEPWHYLWQPAIQLRGLDPRRMRIVLVEIDDHEVDESTRSQLAVLASMGASVEVHRDLSRAGDVHPARRWHKHLAFARVPVPAEEA